jgi:hypothetical protein
METPGPSYATDQQALHFLCHLSPCQADSSMLGRYRQRADHHNVPKAALWLGQLQPAAPWAGCLLSVCLNHAAWRGG